jgi:hypothetical protein
MGYGIVKLVTSPHCVFLLLGMLIADLKIKYSELNPGTNFLNVIF